MAECQKYDILPTIQLLTLANYTLAQYYKKVKDKSEIGENIFDILDFPGFSYNFSDGCPICDAPDCARFIGYYYRPVIDKNGRYYEDFPVARFLCQGKGKQRRVNHRTFSLLHYHLIPYIKYSIPFVFKVLESKHIEGMTSDALLENIADFTATGPVGTDYEYIELSLNRILAFQFLIEEAINKILISQYYQEVKDLFKKTFDNDNNRRVRIKTFLKFCQQFQCHKTHPPIRGPCALSYDYYLQGGAYKHNSYFLFGTPSQFRILI